MARDYDRYDRVGRSSRRNTGLPAWFIPIVALCLLCVLAVFGTGMYFATQYVASMARGTSATPPPPVNPQPPANPQSPVNLQPPSNQPQPGLLAPPPVQPGGGNPAQPPRAPRAPRPLAQDGYSLQEKARDFTPRNEMYTAHMPAGEKSRDIQKLFRIGQFTVPYEGAEVESGGTTYAAASLGIPAVIMRDIPAGDRYEMIWEGLYKSKGGKLAGKKAIQQANVDGKEFLVEFDNGAARVQVFTIAGWVIMGVVEGKDMDTVRSAASDDFLAGIKLSDQAKKLYGDIKR